MPAAIARIVVLLLSISLAAPLAAAPGLSFERAGGIPITVFSSYTLENRVATPLTAVEFLVPAPVKMTSLQRCTDVRASHPHTLRTDPAGNQTLRFVFPMIPPYGKKIVTLHADVELAGTAGWSMGVDPPAYLRPARYIEAGHENILRIARSLSDATPKKTAEKIYRFVAGHVRPDGFSGREYGALYALEHGKGDCTEAMYLFVALCRAAGIPARCIGGYTFAASTVLRPWQHHNWAEFHDGEAWRLADPQRKMFAVGQSSAVATRVLHDLPEGPAASFYRFYAPDGRVKATMNE